MNNDIAMYLVPLCMYEMVFSVMNGLQSDIQTFETFSHTVVVFTYSFVQFFVCFL